MSITTVHRITMQKLLDGHLSQEAVVAGHRKFLSYFMTCLYNKRCCSGLVTDVWLRKTNGRFNIKIRPSFYHFRALIILQLDQHYQLQRQFTTRPTQSTHRPLEEPASTRNIRLPPVLRPSTYAIDSRRSPGFRSSPRNLEIFQDEFISCRTNDRAVCTQ